MQNLPLPPFTEVTAKQKVRLAENAWNTQHPESIVLAYSLNTQWRNRDTFVNNRDQALQFLQTKWQQEQQYRLIKELWAYHENRIAVRYAYEWHNASGQWYRSYGNENWEFDENGLMKKRFASINDLAIDEQERTMRWPLGPRPDNHAGLSELGL